ncbi:hypothetical protein PCC7424_4532 [Gloeothece citriformis PCC 7424]|uniref:Uncharacterized protein n=1 Tax=Gloeothece citriformis (strain PCC 7424) TaxID=65393 RepID=B7KAC1_GLOC7|nr:hypothetical protein [Gloeothece citriformis]ACK72895.1 hypothetical protein PCC7424_4532 [Gloeothece citriformis PCC 7424]
MSLTAITLEQDELLEAADNLKIAWDLPENLDSEQLAHLMYKHIESWLEDLCEHPDFFFKDNSKLKHQINSLVEQSEDLVLAA